MKNSAFQLRTWLLPLLTAGVLLVPLATGRAQEPSKPFVPVWMQKDCSIDPEEKARAVSDLAAQEPYLQHVVVLIHGFDTPKRVSAAQYTQIATDVRGEFGKLGERVGVLGIQWPSDVGPRREWLTQSFFSFIFRKIGLKNAIRDPYRSRVEMSREIGRQGLRDLLFAVKDRFPDTRLHVFAHSLGTEMVLHAADPGLTLTRHDYRPLTFEPQRKLQFDLVAILGADVDVDYAKRAPRGDAERGTFPMLLWQTLPRYGTARDKVLRIRKLARGRAALGNDVPKLRAEQIDQLLTARRLIFDIKNIPTDHAFVHYYTQQRITQLAEAAATLRDPSNPRSELLKNVGGVLTAPNSVEGIRPYLFGNETSPKIYALWRLEHLLCGNSHHLETGYSQRVLSTTLRRPMWLDGERDATECNVVKQGLWPPPDVVERVQAAAQQKRLARQR